MRHLSSRFGCHKSTYPWVHLFKSGVALFNNQGIQNEFHMAGFGRPFNFLCKFLPGSSEAFFLTQVLLSLVVYH